ncbi:MAG: hypothetical protein Q7T24_03655, partial [Deltaproteobacteria bacterium]|nr:hypothetical protein [Deltaproteobacteria bacterium]
SSERPLIIIGRLEKDEDKVKLLATDITPVDEAKKMEKKLKIKNTHITAPADALDADKLTELKKVLEANPGSVPVYLHLLYPEDRVVVIALSESLKITPAEEVFSKIKDLIDGSSIKVI